ncbi:hypothetical protein [Erwinia sp. HR93]|uniref:hypothetical protein n=1 Tax=Erwinia sp. HR93 TaxID=3094840 RepID=UPI002ADEE036|nr:hypothetical protein [Erwinia sp. HR93]MEA1062911.1 hypothetical protein [Erwinia sp. HR93]
MNYINLIIYLLLISLPTYAEESKGIKEISANGHQFLPDEHFPTTGFSNASFNILLYENNSITDYTWHSNKSWASIDQNGKVILDTPPTEDDGSVIIKGESKKGDETITYPFTITTWFINGGNVRYPINKLQSTCAAKKYDVPPFKIITNATVGNTGSRNAGTLWGEWGNLAAYGWPTDITYWTNDVGPEGYHYLSSLKNGYLYNDYKVGNDTGSVFIVCSKKMASASKIKSITANNFTYSIDDNFPNTGFIGANFKINIDNDKNVIWKTDSNWIKVDNNGIVTILEKPSPEKNKATITINFNGTEEEYAFTIKKWFINAGKTKYSISNAVNYCKNKGYSLTSYKNITNAIVGGSGTRGVGNLWSEWGNLATYNWATDITYWTNDIGQQGYHYLVNLSSGYLYNDYNVGQDKGSVYVVCSLDI